jgi:hypothetical protein
MKVHTITAMATLLAGFLGAYAWVPVYSATQESDQTSTQMAPAAPSSKTQSPTASEPANIMSGKGSNVCARLDKNHDGYVNKTEFKASGKPAKLFRSTDVGHQGKLTIEQCNKALAG